MSTNDDSASRRGRRADQGDHRGPARQDRDDRWDQSSSRERVAADPYQDQRGRDGQPQRGGYSNFSRHAPNQPEPALPQGHYQEPGQRNDSARYVEPGKNAYTAPSPPYEQEPHPGFNDSGRWTAASSTTWPPIMRCIPRGRCISRPPGRPPIFRSGIRRAAPTIRAMFTIKIAVTNL